MDVVGGLATVGGVLALANQILQGVITLRKFVESFTNAPTEVKEIIEALATLETVLENVQRNTHKDSSTLHLALQHCKSNVEKLVAIANELLPGFASFHSSKRAWAALKTISKEKKIKEFSEKLEHAKTTLSLAFQAQECVMQQANHTAILSAVRNISQDIYLQRDATKQQMDQMMSMMSLLALKQHKTPQTSHVEAIHGRLEDHFEDVQRAIRRLRSTLPSRVVSQLTRDVIRVCQHMVAQESQDLTAHSSATANTLAEQRGARWRTRRRLIESSLRQLTTPFGTIICRCNRYIQRGFTGSAHNELFETIIKMTPSWWLLRCGLSYQVDLYVHKLAQGNWTTNLKTRRLIPNDALIFQYCERGNLEGVRSLLQRGLASVTDVNDEDNTPLDVAATWWQSEICGLLLDASAEISFKLLSHQMYERRVMIHMFLPTRYRPGSEQIETLRKFLQGGREMLFDIEINQLLRSDIFAMLHGPEDTYWWLLQHYLPELRSDPLLYDDQWWADQVKEFVIRFPQSNKFSDLLDHCTISAVQRAVLRLVERLGFLFWREFPSMECFRLMVNKIRSLSYSVILEEGFTLQSPLSIALRSMLGFSRFQTILLELNVDITQLICNEIDHGCCKSLGWTTQSLQALFQVDIQLDEKAYERKDCSHCPMDVYLIRESRIVWQQQLDRIKNGSDGAIGIEGDGLPCFRQWQIFRELFDKTPLCFFCLAKGACLDEFDFRCQKCMYSCFSDFNSGVDVYHRADLCETRHIACYAGFIGISEDNAQVSEVRNTPIDDLNEEDRAPKSFGRERNDPGVLDDSVEESEEIWYECNGLKVE